MSNSASQLIPFIYSSSKNSYITSFEFYGDYVFAGLCNSGLVVRSKNRYSWEVQVIVGRKICSNHGRDGRTSFQ